MSRFTALWLELRRRHVVRVAAAYAVAAWVLIQVAATVFPLVDLPRSAVKLVLALVVAGFPVALTLAWIFELTREGVELRAETEALSTEPRSGIGRIRGLAALGGALLLAGVIAFSFPGIRGGSAGVGERIESIAVLPFVDLSPAGDQEYFSDGISEELLNALGKVEGLRVPARTSSFAFKGRNADIREIGEKLGVQAVLEGSVRKDGDRVRISTELVDVANGYRLWSETYDRELSSIFAIQDEIAHAILAAVRLRLAGGDEAPRVARATADMQAYNLYLRGRYAGAKSTREGLRQATEFYRQAIERDPTFALPHAGLADAYNAFVSVGYGDPREFLPRARAAASRALELDPSLAEAHTSLATAKYWSWDWKGAEASFKRAIELNPGYARAHYYYAFYVEGMGRHEEAITEAVRAEELDPLSPAITSFVAMRLFMANRDEEARQQLRKALDLEPNYFWTHYWLAMLNSEAGRYEEALESAQRAVELSGQNPVMILGLGIVHARAGNHAAALQVVERVRELSERGYAPAYFLAMIYAQLGNEDDAFRWLDRAYQQRDPWIGHLKTDRHLRPLHSDPRFTELLRRVRLE